ncbi:unnamed protein product, partial [Rotaria sp. Silwood2]
DCRDDESLHSIIIEEEHVVLEHLTECCFKRVVPLLLP